MFDDKPKRKNSEKLFDPMSVKIIMTIVIVLFYWYGSSIDIDPNFLNFFTPLILCSNIIAPNKTIKWLGSEDYPAKTTQLGLITILNLVMMIGLISFWKFFIQGELLYRVQNSSDMDFIMQLVEGFTPFVLVPAVAGFTFRVIQRFFK